MDTEPKVVFLSKIDGYVQSFTNPDHQYLVWHNNDKWTCECLDFVFRGFQPEYEDCKHIRLFKDKLREITE